APRYLGLRVALVKDFARIHWQNLVNFGVLPLTFVHEEDYELLEQGDVLVAKNLKENVKLAQPFHLQIKGKDEKINVEHALSKRQIDIMLNGGIINWVKDRV